MRKFIPLAIFKELYPNESELLTPDGMSAFRNQLTIHGNRIVEAAGFNTDKFMAFEETLNNPSSVVFYGWIEQHSVLKKALIGEKISLFVDAEKHLDHTLSTNYKSFVSQVLSERLMREKIASDAERRIAFSFVQLLDERHRAVVESQLFKPYQERLDQLKSISDSISNEQELVNLVQPLCSDEIIASVNYLSRASYASKLGYVDKILDTIHSKACTVRFANWVLERMSLVDLNKEHLYKLSDLRKDLRQGNLTVKNHRKGRTPFRWKTLLSVLIILTLVGSVIYLIVFMPYSAVEPPEFANNTSFREFSREERIRMDSLLREMDHPFEKEDTLDPLAAPVQIGVDVDLILRKPFKNDQMESIYDDLMKDVELKENHPSPDCPPLLNANFKPFNTVSTLGSMNGIHAAVVRNESEYDIILYVAENSKDGRVYASMIKPNETIEFKLNKFNTLMIVAGNTYQGFLAPKSAKVEEHPSDQYKFHFCETDGNFEETINTSYQFMDPREGKNKFMVMGAKSGYVHLVDVHGVLESY